MSILSWLQSTGGLRIDGTIPVWGLIVFIVGIAGAVITAAIAIRTKLDVLTARMTAHELLDVTKFAEVKEDLARINDSLDYLVRHSQKESPSVGSVVQAVLDRIKPKEP